MEQRSFSCKHHDRSKLCLAHYFSYLFGNFLLHVNVCHNTLLNADEGNALFYTGQHVHYNAQHGVTDHHQHQCNCLYEKDSQHNNNYTYYSECLDPIFGMEASEFCSEREQISIYP